MMSFQDPCDPCESDVEPRASIEHPVQGIPLGHDVGGDLLRGVDPSADRHAPLREMAKLVGQYGLEFADGKDVDQAETDLEVLLRRPDEVDQRKVVEDAGIDPSGEENSIRTRGTQFIRKAVEKCEQVRLSRFRHFGEIA